MTTHYRPEPVVTQVTEPVFRLVDHLEIDHHVVLDRSTTVVEGHARHIADHRRYSTELTHDHAEQSWWSRLIEEAAR